MRLFQLAERFGLPVVTLVDTCGAWPSFEVRPESRADRISLTSGALKKNLASVLFVRRELYAFVCFFDLGWQAVNPAVFCSPRYA